jgi:fructose-1,6-bisphosphatase/inositol monophosphatase family enzyme
MALNYCLVAKGDFEGVVSLTKDAFPEFAGLHIANRSGAVATNILGDENIAPDDRVFICGSNKEIYNQLLAKTKSVLT